MITIHTKEGYNFLKTISNDPSNLKEHFNLLSNELESFIDKMKENQDDLKTYNILLDKFLIVQHKLYEKHHVDKVSKSY